ncbi:hypothetical protein JCM19992_17330 [Thermostilla marina]
MPRYRLQRPGQPLAVRIVYGTIEFLASLRLAVILLSVLVVVLAVATFIEKGIGPAASQFAVYQSWWFYLLGTLLGINILFAALIRYPWKRYQTGFVITHAGLLVLLIGCLVSALRGIEATLSVQEGALNHIAVRDSHHFELTIDKNDDHGNPDKQKVSFNPGPFSWRSYSDWTSLFWAAPGKLPAFPWNLAVRDRGVLYDRDGIRLETLDYYADSEIIEGGLLTLYVSSRDASGKAGDWEPLTMRLRPLGNEAAAQGLAVAPSEETLGNGVRLVYTVAGSPAEAEAFRHCVPSPKELAPLPEQGIVILYAEGKRFVLPLDDDAVGKKIELPNTSIEVTVKSLRESSLGVVLEVSGGEGPAEEMSLFATHPHFSRQARKHEVFGAYWVLPKTDASSPHEMLMGEVAAAVRSPRIEICQTATPRLLVRTWRGGVTEFFELPLDRRKATALAGSPWETRMVVDTLLPFAEEGEVTAPLPIRRSGNVGRTGMTTPRVKVRLTVDGNTVERWISDVDPRMRTAAEDATITCRGEGRAVRLRLTRDTFDTGFRVKLNKFERKMDPGTRQPAYYASSVDLFLPVDLIGPEESTTDSFQEIVDEDGTRLRLTAKDVRIELNHPVPFTDPRTRRMFRVYQSSFSGPFRPGDPGFPIDFAAAEQREEIYVSHFTLNYDPGRGLKYFGSLMIVAGIAVMFFMKAYFFRRRTPESPASSRRNDDKPHNDQNRSETTLTP